MSPLGWALIQYDWRYKKRKFGPQKISIMDLMDAGEQRKDHVRIQQESGHWWTKEKMPMKKPNLPTNFISNFQFQNCEKINFCHVNHLLVHRVPGRGIILEELILTTSKLKDYVCSFKPLSFGVTCYKRVLGYNVYCKTKIFISRKFNKLFGKMMKKKSVQQKIRKSL